MKMRSHRPIALSFVLFALAAADALAGSRVLTAEALYDLHRGFLLKPDVLSGYFSSYDRTGGNDDGFEGTWSSLYRLDDGRHVIVDLHGPGCLYTLWFTGPHAGYEPSWGQLRFYLDNEKTPRLEIPGKELFLGDHPLFPRLLVADEFTSTGGCVAHVPIPFRDRLLITTDQPVGFYNAYCHLYPAGAAVDSWPAGQSLTPAVEAFRTAGSEPPLPAETRWHRGTIRLPAKSADRDAPPAAEILNLTHSGLISAVYLNPTKPLTADVLNNLYLRCWWDDNDAPAVDVPLGPFFAGAQGEAAVRALPIGMSPSGPYYCYFPMPFAASARIQLENRAAEPTELYYQIAVEKLPDLTRLDRQGRFHAVFNRQYPTRPDLDYTILDLQDTAGLYLGHVLIVDPRDAADARWWEGDLRIRTDGLRQPFLNGTGHEDELLGGWSTRWLQGPYSLPLHGLPSVRPFPRKAGLKYNAAMTAYRFFAGGIPFRSAISVSTEHGTENNAPTNYASVAFYYAAGPSCLKLTDTLDLSDPRSPELHDYTCQQGRPTDVLTAPFDGDAGRNDCPPLSKAGRADQQAESFSLRIAPENRGVLLRRLFHQSFGRHHARVFIDDRPAGAVHHPDDNRVDRWRQADLVLPAELTAGKSSLRVRVETLAGTYNTFTCEAWSIVP